MSKYLAAEFVEAKAYAHIADLIIYMTTTATNN